MQEKKNLEPSIMKFIEPTQVVLDFFINKEIVEAIGIELNNFAFFFELADIDGTTRNEINTILSEARRLPAALGGYHGDYIGGLFDHTLLVVNYANYLCNSLKDKSWLKKVLLTAICHDFGTVHYYGFKLDLKDRKIKIHINDADDTRQELTSRFKLSGKDRHVENGVAVIKKYLTNHDLLFDDERYLAIAFHHGSWSKYRPQKMNAMGSLIHIADMFASQILKI